MCTALAVILAAIQPNEPGAPCRLMRMLSTPPTCNSIQFLLLQGLPTVSAFYSTAHRWPAADDSTAAMHCISSFDWALAKCWYLPLRLSLPNAQLLQLQALAGITDPTSPAHDLSANTLHSSLC